MNTPWLVTIISFIAITIPRMFHRREGGVEIYLVCLGLAFHATVIEHDVMGVSLRIYPILLAGVLALAKTAARKTPAAPQGAAQQILTLWCCLAGWIWLRAFHQGEISGVFAHDFLSAHVLSLILFLVLVTVRPRPFDAGLLAGSMAAVVAVNAVFALGQSFGIPIFWQIASELKPLAFESRRLDSSREIISRCFGLAGSPVGLGVLLLTFGGIFPALLFSMKPGRAKLVLGAGGLALCLGAAMAAQSRSALLGLMAQAAAAAWLSFRRSPARSGKRPSAMWKLILVSSAALWMLFQRLSVADAGDSRMLNFQDPYRRELAEAAWDSFLHHPFLGPGLHTFATYADLNEVVHPPHNMFLNAMVLLGLPGLLIAAAFTWVMLRLAWRSLTAPCPMEANTWIVRGLALGIFGYFFNALSHNESVVSGGFLLYLATGALILAKRRMPARGPA